MRLSNWFKIIWWLLLLLTTSFFLINRFAKIDSYGCSAIDGFVFILWVILILYPIFSEISFFGLKVKKELEGLKNAVQFQMLNLQNLQNRLNFNQTFNIAQPTTAMPAQTEKAGSKPNISKFSEMQKKILATLWHYQQVHHKDDTSHRWTFTISPFDPDYAEYLQAIAGLIKIRLVSVSPENYQCMLTAYGIVFMKENRQLETEENLFYF